MYHKSGRFLGLNRAEVSGYIAIFKHSGAKGESRVMPCRIVLEYWVSTGQSFKLEIQEGEEVGLRLRP